MTKLDEAIANTAYILDSLIALRNIYKIGCCNDCGIKNKCKHAPKVGQMVRYNCPFYVRKDEALKAEGYESGLNIAWGLAKKIVVDMDVHERAKIFFDNAEAATHEEPFKSYSFEDAFRKMAEYEKQKYEKQKKEIEVGDEISFSDGTTGYVIMPDYNEKDMLVSTSDCACLQLIRKSNKNPFFKWEKTGMRNGEIVKMVKAIKEES